MEDLPLNGVMRVPASPRITTILCIIIVLLLGICAKLSFDGSMYGMRTELARGQIEVIEEIRREALKSDVTGAVDSLRYALEYYPSGTKQIPGSRLDRIVETQRVEAVQAIIAHLRIKAGTDLGSDPRKWIEKFGNK